MSLPRTGLFRNIRAMRPTGHVSFFMVLAFCSVAAGAGCAAQHIASGGGGNGGTNKDAGRDVPPRVDRNRPIEEGGLAGCGNGVLNGAEQCDDGNPNGGDGCSPSCQVEADYVCMQDTSGVSKCVYTARC